MFKVEFIGNLGADAQVKDSNGSKFIAMRVAVSDRWTTESGEKKERTNWIDVTINNPESKLLPYLKAGTKIFVRGNATLRVYSSPKDRCMKAGMSCAASEIEFVGAQVDEVPRQLVNPDNGELINVSKHFWCNLDTKGMKKDELKVLYDAKQGVYLMDKGGFIKKQQDQPAQEAKSEQEQEQKQS